MPSALEPTGPQEIAKQIYRSVVQALVPLVILHSAERGLMYGRAVSKRLSTLGYRISSGQLYPLLRKMERDGLLSARACVVSGRTRRYYALTQNGRTSLAQVRRTLSGLAEQIRADSHAPATRGADGQPDARRVRRPRVRAR